MQFDQVSQLVAEQLPTLGTAVIRIGKAQRKQGIQHFEVAHDFAVDGFHAQDGHNNRGRYTIVFGNLVQGQAMFLPELDATLNAGRVYIAFFIRYPTALDAPFGGAH